MAKINNEMLRQKYETLSTEDLMKAVTINKLDYEFIARETMKNELEKRNVSDEDIAKFEKEYSQERVAPGPKIKDQEIPQVMTDLPSALYFSVSKTKLVVMSIFSWGLYEVYWFYKNWQLIKERTGRDISPWWRAIFFPFFCYSLFKSVKESAHSHGILSEIRPGLLAFIYIALEIVSDNLPSPYWFFTYLTFLPLLPVQEVINQINLKVAGEYELNDRFSWKNIVVILVGGIMLLLTLTETFMPE